MIEKLDRISFQFVSRIYNIFYRSKLVFELLRKITPAVDLKDKVKLEETIKQGSVLHNCGTIVLIVGDRRIALSEDSAQYALYNMILYAQTKGRKGHSCVSKRIHSAIRMQAEGRS